MTFFDGGQPNTAAHVMRAPCRHCGHQKGRLEPTNGQNCVYCLRCGRHAYNAPKTETGEPQRTVRTRPDIKPSKRARILQRDSYRCVLCGHADWPLHIGHCISVEEGLAAGANETELYDDENLAAMCEECNSGLGSGSVDLRLMLRLLRIRRNYQPRAR